MHLIRRRRIAVFVCLIALFVGGFTVKLVDIQVASAASLNAEARDRRSLQRIIYGERGAIVDRNGIALAGSIMRYDITVSPAKARDFYRKNAAGAEVKVTVSQAASEMGAILGMSGDQVLAKINAALKDDPQSDFAYIAQLVDLPTYQAVDALHIPWQSADRHPSRTYPNGAVAGNLLGYLGIDGTPLAGLELDQDKCLASSNGSESYLRSGGADIEIPGSRRVETPARNGGQVRLTIDSQLQWFAQQAALAQVQNTGAQWATVVVQDVKTGELLAVVDVPTVDPNAPQAVASTDRGSRAFSAPFEPGSTFKSLTAASLLDAGLATPADKVVAPYRFQSPSGADFHDSSRHADLRLTLAGVLVESSNTGISQFGTRLSDDRRYSYMRAFGVGSPSEVDFPAESGGILHDVKDWDVQTEYTTMFGQGLATTAIQIASVYQTIGNGGVRMPVSLVSGCATPNGTIHSANTGAPRRVISTSAAQQTVSMLEQVYTKGWLAKAWAIPGYRVATKTGTAQVPDGHGGYQRGYLVSVAGIAPADDPRYVVSVSIMNPVRLNSSAASAPVFQQVMSEALKIGKIVPSGAPTPNLATSW